MAIAKTLVVLILEGLGGRLGLDTECLYSVFVFDYVELEWIVSIMRPWEGIHFLRSLSIYTCPDVY